jgi:hypothetical protein
LFGPGFWDRMSLTSELTLAFLVTLVNLLNKVTKLIQVSRVVKMHQLILDSFQHGSVCLPIER